LKHEAHEIEAELLQDFAEFLSREDRILETRGDHVASVLCELRQLAHLRQDSLGVLSDFKQARGHVFERSNCLRITLRRLRDEGTFRF
jgi:hypothetical protein